MRNLSIFQKILVIVAVLAIGMVIIGIYSTFSLRSSIIEKTKQNLQALAENSGETFWSFIEQHTKLIELLSKDANVMGVYKNEYQEDVWMKKLFDSVIKSYPDVMNVYVGLKDKRMYLVPEQELPEGYDPTSRPWYQAAVAKPGQIIVTEPYADASTGKLVVTVAKTVQTDEGIVGVVALDFDVSKLSDTLLSKGKELGYLNAIVSAEGNIIMHSDKTLVGKNVKDTEFFQKWVSGPESGVFGYTFNNEKRITGYKRLPNGWTYATVVLEKDLMKEANLQTLINISITIVAVILGVIVALFISRAFVIKPINDIVESADKIANGDLTVRINYSSKDEIGKLAAALDKMVLALREIATNIERDSQTVKQEASKVAAVSEEVSATIEELTAQVDSVNSNVNNASAAIEEMTSGIEEVAASAQNVANASQKLSEEAQKVTQLANEGQKAIFSIADVIVQTREKADVTFQIVEKLSESAKNIGEIVDTINSIAEQTNLLALNAAIEAARAGEAGRGFAVVADEIRKLAEESKQATQNIAEILRGIVDNSMKASEATNETVEIVNKAYSESNLVKSQFEQILQSIVRMSQMTENLAASAQEQSAAAEEMSSAMDSASKSMVSVVEQMNEVTMAIKQQADAMSNIARTAENLDDIAEKLVETVRRFKI
ncbi:methyl-accepting chemotaxis protein [Fervidobacterium pennivorans subsp. shakshaketiis]|uniref:Methyl-accepting chemotaxis protein n=1 Tax=Fervidobacterium pennivorans (strain DSM 9078 / Ven5) TaxID=771875 RepID=H9UA26_FERPD|nr:methyl-accepting chemotaxis protein [Fervidobacterium pennivorans]AFG34369.1 methyl-accepting chemotaxis protein [Fervidobacterium pennivorans DSM 9078]QIV77723.1 methyl-accepting chemotaxis protein [Fervidobacterium pennivorans subsp. keratinolyticus]